MSNAASLRFSCNSCSKSYVFKPELANKKVKCKCGAVLVVPDLTAASEDEMYDIADEPKQVVPVAKPVRPVTVLQAPSPAATQRGRGPQVLGYKGAPTAAQRQRTESALIDMKRDIYIPTGLIVASFAIIVLAVMSRLIRGDPIAVSTALTLYSMINALLMIAGALFIGGKVGISFGDVWTAVLKFVAIALFVGMITTIIDAKFGLLGMAVLSIATAAVLYTVLFVYLFSMDLEDSIWIVCFFIGVRTALSWLLLPILLGFFTGGSGAAFAGGGTRPSANAAQMKLAEKIEENKDLGLVEEAVEYIKSGKQSYWKEAVDGAYAAGAEYVGFSVVRDINGRGSPYSIVIQMPEDAVKRAAIVKVINDFRAAGAAANPGSAPVLTDKGGEYIEIPI